MAINTLNSAKERDAAARDQQIQGAKDAARRGAEITSGTTKRVSITTLIGFLRVQCMMLGLF